MISVLNKSNPLRILAFYSFLSFSIWKERKPKKRNIPHFPPPLSKGNIFSHMSILFKDSRAQASWQIRETFHFPPKETILNLSFSLCEVGLHARCKKKCTWYFVIFKYLWHNLGFESQNFVFFSFYSRYFFFFSPGLFFGYSHQQNKCLNCSYMASFQIVTDGQNTWELTEENNSALTWGRVMMT